MKNLGVNWRELVWEMPLGMVFLCARQEQYNYNDKVMTLGDKELIDDLAKNDKKRKQ